MALIDKLKSMMKSKQISNTMVEAGKIYAPITGKVIALEDIPDEVFSQGMVGKGCGIEPEVGEVVAPVNGTIVVVANTKHAIGIRSVDGAEIIIHVGMDTVNMDGWGFTAKVQVGQEVLCGQPLLLFDMEEIKKAGHPSTTAFIVTNSDEFSTIEFDIGCYVEMTNEIGRIEK